jgi:hypothetical protein
MLLVNEPVPVPSLVVELAVVGFDEVLQHTPRAVTEQPPWLLILPPDDAVEQVIELAAVVDATVGAVVQAV